MYLAKVYITPKKTVADPQGLTIEHALGSLGFSQAAHVRIGKFITLSVSAATPAQAKKLVDQMCQKLLANPVIEDYEFTLTMSAHPKGARARTR